MLLRNDFSQFTHFFWDLDGTLTRSAEGIVNSVRYALESFGIKEADDENLKRFIGPPLAESFNVFYGLNEEQCNKVIEKYREFYTEKGIFQNAVYEGIPETLQKLKESGKKLYVATSKPEVFMFRILEHFNLAQYFDFAGGADMAEARSEKHKVIEYVIKHENLQAEQKSGKILMIGDRKHDILGARKNGLKCCAVLWGYGSQKEFEEFEADFIISKPADLV